MPANRACVRPKATAGTLRERILVYCAGTLLLAAAAFVAAVVVYDRRSAEGGADVSASGSSGRVAGIGTDQNGRRREGSTQPPPLTPGSLWQPVSMAEVDAADIPAYKEVVEGRALVRIVHQAVPLQVGDRVAVAIPQIGKTYRPVVDRVETGPGSTHSVAGHVEISDGSQHRFVYTVGPRSTFAHIGTPNGTFELVANRHLGWLMPSANMDQHVDYSKPDYYIVRPNGPDRPGHVQR